ncbi:MAG: hypothetical protein Q4E13_02110 [Clostridia bacterium]|nr:hypothetical protein [Clostridia bacterium]
MNLHGITPVIVFCERLHFNSIIACLRAGCNAGVRGWSLSRRMAIHIACLKWNASISDIIAKIFRIKWIKAYFGAI